MSEKNKAQLLEEIEELKAQIEKISTDAGISEIIEEAKAELEKATAELESLRQINEELSKQNALQGIQNGNLIVLDGKSYTSIANKFHMNGALVTLEILQKDASKAAQALALGFLKEKEDKK